MESKLDLLLERTVGVPIERTELVELALGFGVSGGGTPSTEHGAVSLDEFWQHVELD